MANNYTDSFAGDPYFIHKGEQLSAAGMTAALNTKEKVANKTDTLSNSSTEYPSTKAVYDSLNEKDNNAVHKIGNETIAGTKTFSDATNFADPKFSAAKTTDAANDGTKIASEAQVYKKQDSLTAEQLSSLASLKTLSFFPRGTILTFNKDAWDAKDNDFKQIWKVCDGTNGTPNLVNRFLRGAVYPAGGTGGADSQSVKLTVDNLPSHNHRGVAQAHYLAPYGDDDRVAWEGVNYNRYTENTGGDEPFTVNTVPSYYTVIYIMKIA